MLGNVSLHHHAAIFLIFTFIQLINPCDYSISREAVARSTVRRKTGGGVFILISNKYKSSSPPELKSE